MKKLINCIDDPLKASRIIARKFLIHEVATQFVTQKSADGKKLVLLKTHEKFVKCITSM